MMILRTVERLTRQHKQFVLLMIDVVIAPISLFLSFVFIFPFMPVKGVLVVAAEGCLVVMATTLVTSIALGVPKIKLRSYEVDGTGKTGVMALMGAAGLLSLRFVTEVDLPLSGILLFVLIFIFLSVTTRLAMLRLFLASLRFGKARMNVIIYGAGNTGNHLEAALRGHETIRVVAFVDDSPEVQRMTIHGLKIYNPSMIERLVTRYDVSRVLLAIPSAPLARQAVIARTVMDKGLQLQALPSFAQLIGSETIVDTLQPVSPGTFLGRPQFSSAHPQAASAYAGKCVMVTGAGGSVGSELCRQIIQYRPARIVLFEVSEIGLYTIDRDLVGRSDIAGIEVIPVLGSVTESRLARAVIAQNGGDVVFHAAAYKHVPLVEANPIAGLVNNVLGTRTIAEAALHEGVKRFILISTDKAVRPTNVMGASKRLAEQVVQDMAHKSGSTYFSIVRFGNVLGSSGSVVPLFKDQIAKGGPITLTHEDVTRYFMTIAEASSLVLVAGALSDNRGDHFGDLFVLDMGKPIRIRDLAERMIRTAGYSVRGPQTPDGDIEIVVTGLRPGEKLHEELLIEPGMLTTPHEKILRVQEKGLTPMQMASALRDLRSAIAVGDRDAALAVIQTYVEGYQGVCNDRAQSA